MSLNILFQKVRSFSEFNFMQHMVLYIVVVLDNNNKKPGSLDRSMQ